MLTLAGFGLLAVLVGGVLFVLAAYLLPPGEQIAPPIRDEPIWTLPAERPLTCDDVTVVRLPVALRGYRFAETDLLLDRLADELRTRDAEIERLRGSAQGDWGQGGLGQVVPDEPAWAPDAATESDEH